MIQRIILRKIHIGFVIMGLVVTSCWKNRSPEDLIRLKESFKSQVTKFESRKEVTNKKVSKGLESLGALKQALEETRNEDKEFARVYGDWERVNRKVNNLVGEYDSLKEKAGNLFIAMEKQTASLKDETSKSTLMRAINKAKNKYNTTLKNTSVAIDKLKLLHSDAVEVIKALEVAAALNSFDNINDQMKSIENRVEGIMRELNVAVVESKNLYQKKITELGE